MIDPVRCLQQTLLMTHSHSGSISPTFPRSCEFDYGRSLRPKKDLLALDFVMQNEIDRRPPGLRESRTKETKSSAVTFSKVTPLGDSDRGSSRTSLTVVSHGRHHRDVETLRLGKRRTMVSQIAPQYQRRQQRRGTLQRRNPPGEK
jgi:hypothetical protein